VEILEINKIEDMKKIIRTGVFETNSSSSHSLSVAREDQEFVYDTIYPDQNGLIKVTGEEFGWGWTKYNDSMTKLAYLFQDSPESKYDDIKEIVMKQTGATEVDFIEGGGYIDHDGCGTTHEVRGSNEDMRNFVFNKNSWLFIGNDNGEPDPTFYNVPEFKDGKQFMPEYQYELVIDGLNLTTKYLHVPNDEEVEQGINSITDGVYLTEDGEFFVDDSIFFQVSRQRDKFYERSYQLHQDYSKMEVLFLKEQDDKFREVGAEIEKEVLTKKIDYWERSKMKTERARKIPGLIKAVKFEIKKL